MSGGAAGQGARPRRHGSHARHDACPETRRSETPVLPDDPHPPEPCRRRRCRRRRRTRTACRRPSTTRAGRSIRRRCASRRSTRRRPSPLDDGRGARDGQRARPGGVHAPRPAPKASATSRAARPGLGQRQAPGIRRIRVGDDFAYVGPDGKRVRKAAELQRIRALAIPPAYEDVWICVRANGHLQATGRDARGRKQYRYHPDWRLAKDADKFERMLEFGAALPRIRKRVAADLAAPVGTMPRRDTVLATIVRLLDTTFVRIGNEEYARENKSFGLTTLRNRHAAVSGDRLRLRFRGKSGKEHEVALDDPRVAKVVRRCQAMPGPGAVPVRRRGRRGARRRLGRGQRLHPRCERRRLHGQGLPHLARHGARARAVDRSVAAPRASRGRARRSCSAKSRSDSATRSRSARSRTSIRACSRRSATRSKAELLEALDKAARRAGLSAGERRLLAFLSPRLSARACQAARRRPTLFPTGRSTMFLRPGPERRHPWKNRSFASAIPAAFARWP